MMVSNHFDVRWVDGYSAVSDVPSSLAAMIEKMAAELPSSHDRIELAVRDVRRTDGTVVWVGLLRFVVAVSSAPRPLGFLHAAVLPGGYGLDLGSWRALVARRYGARPEERIRELYEELAESTRDSGRDRLHALAIRPEDVRELIEPMDETERTPVGAKVSSRPPTHRPVSRPSTNRIVIAPASAPRIRPSQPIPRPSQPSLATSVRPPSNSEKVMRAASQSEATTERDLDALPDDPDLPTDVTQPMEAPSGTAAPLSGEHPKQPRPVERATRTWWMAGAVLGTLTLLLGAVGWLAHRHRVLIDENRRLLEQIRPAPPPDDLAEQLRKAQAALAELQGGVEVCRKQESQCKSDLITANKQARNDAEAAEKSIEDVRTKLRDALAALTATTKSKDDYEQRYRQSSEEHKRAVDERNRVDAAVTQLKLELEQRDERLKRLCKGLQSTRLPRECQGIK